MSGVSGTCGHDQQPWIKPPPHQSSTRTSEGWSCQARPVAAASRSQTVVRDEGQEANLNQAIQDFQPSIRFALPDNRDARSGKISSLRPPGDGPDSLRGAEGCLATAGVGDCRPRHRQEFSWRREGMSFVAAGLKATQHFKKRSEKLSEILRFFQNF